MRMSTTSFFFICYNLITLYFVSMNETLQRLAEFKNSAKAEAISVGCNILAMETTSK